MKRLWEVKYAVEVVLFGPACVALSSQLWCMRRMAGVL